ncbi:glutathione S-transferase family protein [Maritimibacter sp. 55A14]|uniref:glutathione S-transferase family protein n=1 Tax=Maritimibacter sp. 55A14 TaxID=2174844 RepID=UPI000D60FA71|nr:glutathione S-transferase family protein [Maritimibacter sp. 55A14]PWE29892.1 glutathione S-transferase family protein [Maritimibacter sp. 55A14]
MTQPITLVSHALCPYVQRIAIALAEKGVAHERRVVDLGNKPQWFLDISPLGQTPVLKVGEAALFESAAILEYLEETQPNPLHTADPVERARHRAWIGFGSEVLDTIAGFYSARDAETFEARTVALGDRFRLLEEHLGAGPWFSGADFSLVDAVFGPVFRYFDVFDGIADFGILTGLPKVCAWRMRLAKRPSVRDAVSADYSALLHAFLLRRDGVLAGRIRSSSAA